MRSSRSQLLLGLVLGLLRHAGLLDLLAQPGDLDRLLVALPQLLLDVAQLLAQDVLALLRRQRLLGLLADLLGQLEHLDALRQQRQHLVETLLDVERLQHRLLFRRRNVADAADEIGERRRRIEIVDRRRDFLRDVGQQLHRLAGALAQQVDAGFDLGRQHLGRRRSPRPAPPGTGSREQTRSRESAARPGRSHGGCRRARSHSAAPAPPSRTCAAARAWGPRPQDRSAE